MTPARKTCIACGETKPLTEFRKIRGDSAAARRSHDGHKTTCKSCGTRCQDCGAPIKWGAAYGPLGAITFEQAMLLRDAALGDPGGLEHARFSTANSVVVYWHGGGHLGAGELADYMRGGPLPYELLEAARDAGLTLYARHIPRCPKGRPSVRELLIRAGRDGGATS